MNSILPPRAPDRPDTVYTVEHVWSDGPHDDIMLGHCFNCRVPLPLAQGFRSDYEASTVRWALFSTKQLLELMRLERAENDTNSWRSSLAQTLTGWTRSYGGPGKRFTEDSVARVGRNHVLVTQVCGLDI